MGGATQPTHNHRQAGEKERWQMRFAQTAEDHCRFSRHCQWHAHLRRASQHLNMRGLHRLHPLIRPRAASSFLPSSPLVACFSSLAASPSAGAASAAPSLPAGGSAVGAGGGAAAAPSVDLFYDPRLNLGRRAREVFARVDSRPPSPSLQDRGYLYGLTAEDMASASDAVKRALSTRTGDLKALKRFKTAQIVQSVGGRSQNSGSSLVQGEPFFKDTCCPCTRLRARACSLSLSLSLSHTHKYTHLHPSHAAYGAHKGPYAARGQEQS